MNRVRKIVLFIVVFALMAGCKHKKKPSMTGEDPVKVSDFIDFFQPLQLSYQVADTVLAKKEKDSLLISNKIFTQFVPDSVLNKIFGKGVKPKIYAMGKTVVPDAESYLFVKR